MVRSSLEVRKFVYGWSFPRHSFGLSRKMIFLYLITVNKLFTIFTKWPRSMHILAQRGEDRNYVNDAISNYKM